MGRGERRQWLPPVQASGRPSRRPLATPSSAERLAPAPRGASASAAARPAATTASVGPTTQPCAVGVAPRRRTSRRTPSRPTRSRCRSRRPPRPAATRRRPRTTPTAGRTPGTARPAAARRQAGQIRWPRSTHAVTSASTGCSPTVSIAAGRLPPRCPPTQPDPTRPARSARPGFVPAVWLWQARQATTEPDLFQVTPSSAPQGCRCGRRAAASGRHGNPRHAGRHRSVEAAPVGLA